MHLQTTLILSNSHCSFKTNQKSQFSNFFHPLKVLQKTDNQMIQMLARQSSVNTTKFGRTTKQFQSSKDTFKDKQSYPQISQEQNTNSKKPQYFNEDQGILQHIYQKIYTCSKSPHTNQPHYQPRSTKQCKFLNNKPSPKSQKCYILFGFSINLLQIQNFHALHPQLNLNIKLYQYGDNEYFREVEIKSLEEESIEQKPDKYQKVVDVLGGEDLLDCQEVSFVVCFWENGEEISNRECADNRQEVRKRTYLYFFPNINALRSQQQRREQRTQLTLGFPVSSTTQNRQQYSLASNQPQTTHQTMTSLRKSHQNFRILQVLEYYLKLQCHSQHIMITSNESRIIKQFLDMIYEQSVKQFYIYIDHERKNYNRTSKSTVRSILNNNNNSKNNNKDYCLNNKNNTERDNSFMSEANNSSPSSSKVYTSDICSEKQFISIDGKLVINDEFLSKLSQLKLPEPWLDSSEFREQKQLMYNMKLQEYTENKELKKMKDEFTTSINYLKSLIGLQKVSYDQISIQSLKVIKNAKIRQATQQVKQLQNIYQQKQIRNQQLKLKIKQYQNLKNQKNQDHQHNLSQLRKDILTVQKQLNLHRNQLNAIYRMDQDNQPDHDVSNVDRSNITRDDRKIECSNARISKQSQFSSKAIDKSSNTKGMTKSIANKQKTITNNQKNTLKHKQNILKEKPKNLTQNVFTATSLKDDKQPSSNLKASRHSLIKGILQSSKAPNHAQSFLMNRRSSQLLSKYAPILQQLRKQKYEQSLKQEMTKCEFEAEKQFEKYKDEYTKACRQLKMVLNDCD